MTRKYKRKKNPNVPIPLTKEKYMSAFCIGQEYQGEIISAINRQDLSIETESGKIINLSDDYKACMLHRRLEVLLHHLPNNPLFAEQIIKTEKEIKELAVNLSYPISVLKTSMEIGEKLSEDTFYNLKAAIKILEEFQTPPPSTEKK